MTAPTSTVIRGGNKKEIDTRHIVVGDLMAINQGDKIPADARIIKSTVLEANEAALTGESEAVLKLEEGEAIDNPKLSIGDRKNMVYYGTYITMGNGTAIAVKTGGDTEIGKISQGLEEAGTSEIPIRQFDIYRESQKVTRQKEEHVSNNTCYNSPKYRQVDELFKLIKKKPNIFELGKTVYNFIYP